MSDRTRAEAASLTGVWHGFYSYPSEGPSVSFVATLIESGSHLAGSTHEPCIGDNCPCDTLFATLQGSRDGSAVTLVKTYDGAGPDYQSAVSYEGTLSADGTEIEGRWTIRRWWSGRFLMIRANGSAATIERKAFEPAQ